MGADRSVEWFVGRRREQREFVRFLDSSSSRRTLFVHGPGGIGKSSLLTRFAELAADQDFDVTHLSGLQITDFAVTFDELAATAKSGRAVILIDGCDDLEALATQVRLLVADSAHASTRIVLASRQPPERIWHAVGWDDAAASMPLSALDDEEARDLVARRGISESDASALVGWARGMPLSLAVAADLVADKRIDVGRLDREQDLIALLANHVIGKSVNESGHQVITAASIAPTVTRATLTAALPDVDSGRAEAWLREQPYMVEAGQILRMHDSVRHVVQTASYAMNRAQDVSIRTALADHFMRRALSGDPSSIISMSGLIRDPQVRYGLGQEAGRDTQARGARLDDFDEIMEASGYGPSEVGPARRWFEEAPEHIVVARDARDQLVGWTIAATLRRHPAWAAEDPILGPWIEHARDKHVDQDAFFARDFVDFGQTGAPILATIAWGHAWFIQTMGISTERYCYAATRDDVKPGRVSAEWLTATGHVPQPDLDVADGDYAWRCYFADHGEGGLAALTWRAVYGDLGLEPPRTLPVVDVKVAVRAALRHFHDDRALATNPLAAGPTSGERADYLRLVLRTAIDSALRAHRSDRELARAIELTYFDPEGSTTKAIRRLSMSRATYFRRLNEAMDRMAAVIDREK